MQPLRRLKPADGLPRTQLPIQQALLWGAPLAMALPAPKIQISPAVDKIPHLLLASSPLSPPKEPPTHLGVAPPTLRTLPTPAAPLQPPSNPGGQRTAIKILFLAAISLHLQPLQPLLLPPQQLLQLLWPPHPHPPPHRRPLPPHRLLPQPLNFVVLTLATQHIMKAGIVTSAILPIHLAGQLGRTLLGLHLLKIRLSASHLPIPLIWPLSPTDPLTKTTGLLPQRLHLQSLQNLVVVVVVVVGHPALREKKPGLPHAQLHLHVLAPQPQRPPTRVCPLLSTAVWIPVLKCC